MCNQTELFDGKNEYGELYDDRDELCQSWQDEALRKYGVASKGKFLNLGAYKNIV